MRNSNNKMTRKEKFTLTCILSALFLTILVLIFFVPFFENTKKKTKPSPPNQQMSLFLTERGVLREHPVFKQNIRIATAGNIFGSFSGKIFFSSGSIKGESKDYLTLRFCWSPERDKFVTSEVPMDKMELIRNDDRTAPSIEFIFAQDWLKWNYYKRFLGHLENTNDILKLRYKPNHSSKKLDVLRLIRIRISKKCLEKEPILSQYFQFE